MRLFCTCTCSWQTARSDFGEQQLPLLLQLRSSVKGVPQYQTCDGAHNLQQPAPSEFLYLPASQSRVLSNTQLQDCPMCQPTPHADACWCPVAGDGRQPGRPEEGGGWGQQQRLWGSHLHRWVPAGRGQQLWGWWPRLHCRSVHGFSSAPPCLQAGVQELDCTGRIQGFGDTGSGLLALGASPTCWGPRWAGAAALGEVASAPLQVRTQFSSSPPPCLQAGI